MNDKYGIFASHFAGGGGGAGLQFDPSRNQFVNATETAAPVAPTKKKPNFIQSMLPSIGGLGGGVAGGAAGGALAGTAILPGVGTVAGGLIGALLGGAAGGAAGKIAENKSLGDSAWHDVGKEAAVQGVLSAGPLRLFKGAGAGAKVLAGVGGELAGEAGEQAAAQGGGRLVQALNAAGEKAAQPGIVGRFLGKTAKGAETVAQDLTGTGEQVLKTSTQGKLQTAVNKTLADQFGVLGKPTIRATNPNETIGILAKAGLTKPADIERAASAITGSDGILNKAVVKAVGNAKGVDNNGLKQIFTDALDHNGIVDSDKKSLMSIFKAESSRLLGGPQGSISPTSNPSDVLDVMKSLDGRIADYMGKGGTAHLATSGDKAKANVLMTLKSELQDRLDSAVGDNVKGVLTPELRQQLLSIHPGNKAWADHVGTIMQSPDIAALRGAQSPFVRASKIIDEGANNAFSVGGKMVNNTNSIKGLLVDKALTGGKTKGAQLLAGAVNGGGKLGGGEIAPWGAKQIAARVLPAGLAGALAGAATPPADQSMNAPMSDSVSQIMPNTQSMSNNMSGLSSSDVNSSTMSGGGLSTSNDIFDPANATENVHKILAAGGKAKDVQEYISLVGALQSLNPAPKEKKLSSTQIQQSNNANSGLTDLEDLASQISQDPSVLKKASIPGGGLARTLTGTTDFEAAKKNVVDVIARLRSGAAISEGEQKTYMSLLPGYADTPQSASSKLQRLYQLLSSFSNPQSGTSDTTLQ